MNLARLLIPALVLALAGCPTDPGSGSGVDARPIRPDAAAPDAAGSRLDAAEPEPDAAILETDSGSPVDAGI